MGSNTMIHNYVRKCAQLCPEYVSRLFDDVTTTAKLQNAVSAVVEERLLISHVRLYKAFSAALAPITRTVSVESMTVRSRLLWMRVLAEINQSLCVYFIAMTFLHVAYKTTGNSWTDELLDVLATTCLQSNDARRWLNARHSSCLLYTSPSPRDS